MSKIDRAEKRRVEREEKKKNAKYYCYYDLVRAADRRQQEVTKAYKDLIIKLADMGLAANCKDAKWTITKIQGGENNE